MSDKYVSSIENSRLMLVGKLWLFIARTNAKRKTHSVVNAKFINVVTGGTDVGRWTLNV
jgi:hypothetical protein